MKKIQIEIVQTGMGKTIGQDYAISTNNLAVVLDGCGSGEHSEVGAHKMGERLRKKSKKINEGNFEDIAYTSFYEIVMEDDSEERIISELQFTLIACLETGNEFIVYSAGDGFIITVDKSNMINYIQLDNDVNLANGEAPKYLAYNYIPNRQRYSTKVTFSKKNFAKDQYKFVYVASDGLRFVLGDKFPSEDKELFKKALTDRSQSEIKTILRRNQTLILDDISIAS